MTSQGTAHGRFQRAIHHRHVQGLAQFLGRREVIGVRVRLDRADDLEAPPLGFMDVTLAGLARDTSRIGHGPFSGGSMTLASIAPDGSVLLATAHGIGAAQPRITACSQGGLASNCRFISAGSGAVSSKLIGLFSTYGR